jgi:hypothetical protein
VSHGHRHVLHGLFVFRWSLQLKSISAMDFRWWIVNDSQKNKIKLH